MAETSASAPSAATPAAAAPASSPPVALKKGTLVRLNLKAYASSLEAAASVSAAPAYVVQGPGEILSIKGEYAQLRWRRPVPDVWLRLDQLEPWSEG
jgi:hypothetical protein